MLNNKTTWIVLVLFTLAGSHAAGLSLPEPVLVVTILLLFGIKFILISFQFMALKKAHPFWKFSLVFILVLYISFAAITLNLA